MPIVNAAQDIISTRMLKRVWVSKNTVVSRFLLFFDKSVEGDRGREPGRMEGGRGTGGGRRMGGKRDSQNSGNQEKR